MSSERASCGGCTRRDFLAQGSLAAIATLLAACSSDESPTGTLPTGVTVRLADYPALATVGGISQVSSTGLPVAVVRSGASTFRAFSLRCPHQGSTVQVTGGAFRCPNHGATFNSSGAWTGGERTSSLTELKVTVNASGDTLTITS
jgi:nitrite reductase/ring-hydroxylating ferredoxin subunit